MKTLREAKRRTQQQLADDSGISVTTISRYENERVTMFSAKVLERLAAALDVDPGLLIMSGGAREVPPAPATVALRVAKPAAPPATADDGRDLRPITRQFRALADENRLRIVDMLRAGERCVCELTDELTLRQSLLSFHLKALKDAGLVTDRRQGRWAYYALNPDAFAQLESFVGALPSTKLSLIVARCS